MHSDRYRLFVSIYDTDTPIPLRLISMHFTVHYEDDVQKSVRLLIILVLWYGYDDDELMTHFYFSVL